MGPSSSFISTPSWTAKKMGRRRAAFAVLRTLDTAVSVNLRTGQIKHKPPQLVYENAAKAATPNAMPTSFSLMDSILRIESGLKQGELAATSTLRRGLRHLYEEPDSEEQALSMDEVRWA